MNSPTNWKLFKQDQDKNFWVHICTQDLTIIEISLTNRGSQNTHNKNVSNFKKRI